MVQNEEVQSREEGEATTAGACSVQANAYLAAAAVVAYTTRALWLKLRKITSGKRKANKDHDTENTFEAIEGQQKHELDLRAS